MTALVPAVEERAGEAGLAGGQDDDLGRVLDPRDVVAVERAVLEFEVGEQRVVRVDVPVRRDVRDPGAFQCVDR